MHTTHGAFDMVRQLANRIAYSAAEADRLLAAGNADGVALVLGILEQQAKELAGKVARARVEAEAKLRK